MITVNNITYHFGMTHCGEAISIWEASSERPGFSFKNWKRVTEIPYEENYLEVARAAILAIQIIDRAKQKQPELAVA